MSKDTTKKGDIQENNLFSFSDVLPDKKIQVDFNAPDLSSNGGLVLVGLMKESIARKVARLIPDHRNQLFVQHSYEEMVCQRVGQIMCGYEDANDCDRLRHDSALKMSVGRKASDPDLCSQPTMTRLENHLDKKTELWIKDLKYFRADRMSCSSFKANMFRLFLYGAAYVTAYRLKSKAFSNTEVEVFTMDSFMKRITS